MQAGPRALVEPVANTAMSYADALGAVEHLARQLQGCGLEPGGRVGVLAANGPEALLIFLAICRLGAAAAPLNPALTESELIRACDELQPDAMIVDHPREAITRACRSREIALHALTEAPQVRLADVDPSSEGLPEVSAEAVCLLLQTSGTTGRPKLVPLRQRNLLASARQIADFYALGPEDATYCVMPLFHIHGIVGASLSTLVSGGTVVVPRRVLASQARGHIGEHSVSWFSAVPTIMDRLVDRIGTGKPASLRFGRTSSSALSEDLTRRFESQLDVPLVEAYGMTEASHQMTSNPLPPAERQPGTVGVSAGANVLIVDENLQAVPAGEQGEVAVSGPGVIDGYLDNPEATESAFFDGWFRTGDLGTLTADGYLTLIGRSKDMINRGGEKIMPREIDEVLLSHAAVREAVAYAAPDGKYGEVVHAAVVLHDTADGDELRRHCRESLAAFKVPARIVVVDEIPKGPTGKVQRGTLAERLTP